MGRREQREHIFRLIFRYGFFSKEELEEQVQLYMDGLEGPEKELEYIKEKSVDIMNHIDDLDTAIDEVATGWKVARMDRVDLTIIRLAVYEMRMDEDVPTGVAINEAVELAKRYGSDGSPSFINGILAKLA